jgi:hypothetical protein
MNKMTENKRGEDYLFELAGYLLTCATMALSGEREGSPRYSANRFLVDLSKLIVLPRYVESLEEDPFIKGLTKKLQGISLNFDKLQRLRMEFAVEASQRLQ